MTFADRDLARRLERAESVSCARFVEARSRLSPEVGSKWIDVGGAYAVFDGPSSPITQAFGLGLFEEAAASDVDAIEAFFHEQGAPVSQELCPLAGVAAADALCRRGYRPIEFTSVLHRPLGSTQL